MQLATFTALAEPNRLRIVEFLRQGPQPVGTIANQLGLRQPQASKHLKILNQAGLVGVKPVAQMRVYHLQPKPFKELEGWLEGYTRLWENRLDTLDSYLQELKTS